tara:strand:- start:196 stop:462 length:267 start_codon:yes stop_codon:yes gene_type:complete
LKHSGEKGGTTAGAQAEDRRNEREENTYFILTCPMPPRERQEKHFNYEETTTLIKRKDSKVLYGFMTMRGMTCEAGRKEKRNEAPLPK